MQDVTELPIGLWTQSYKEYLESLLTEVTVRGKQRAPVLRDFKEYHTEDKVHFSLGKMK